ncbi:MAG: hypothetical protein ACKOBF_00570 [Limnohabitans sp.]
MDKEPFIIKSGKGHSVEIEQGSTHARRKSNVVAPQDEAPEERVVKESVQEERKLADLSLQGEDPQASLSPSDGAQHADAAASRASSSPEPVPEGGALAPRLAEVPEDEAALGAPQDGPVMVLEARADEDAKVAKGGIEADRYLSGDASNEAQRDARGPMEQVLGDHFASDHPEALPEEDLRGPGQPEQPLSNRQKVDLLQAQANRIQIEQAGAAPAELNLERQSPDRAAQAAGEAGPEPAAAPARTEDAPPSVAAPVSVEGLPPELKGNLAFTPPPAPEAEASGLLARVRALRRYMSVTDDRLSKLQGKPPIKH